MMCGTLRALDDCVLEEDEIFRMKLEVPSGQDPRIKIDSGRRDVTIVDQDSTKSKYAEKYNSTSLVTT